MNWGKIAVGLRCGYGADPAFVCSWTKLITSGLRAGDEVLEPACELYHHYAAQALVDRFLESPCDSLLFVDDDMTFEPQDLESLRANPRGAGYGILSALYVARRNRRPILVRRAESGSVEIVAPQRGCVLESDFVGLGFTLVRRSVLLRGEPRKMRFYMPADGRGEDVVFCDDARARGVLVGVDCDVVVGHRGKTIMRWTPPARKE